MINESQWEIIQTDENYIDIQLKINDDGMVIFSDSYDGTLGHIPVDDFIEIGRRLEALRDSGELPQKKD